MNERTRDKRRARRLGQWGEAATRLWLRLCGWRIIAANWRCPFGEIDIIARRGAVLALVEVKTRSGADDEPLGPTQRRRLVRSARAFLARHPAFARCDLRFDVMLLRRGRFPRYLKDAFQADG